MGSEMGMWAVQALNLEAGVDEADAITELRERVERLSDDVVAALADDPWITTLDDGEELAEVLTTSESVTYRRAAVAQLKEAIMVEALDVFFSGPCRDRCRFVDSAGRQWIVTGGMTPGDAPTDSCYPIGMLADIGISAEPVSLPTMNATLCCPRCSSTAALGSIEVIEGFCQILVEDDDDWTFGGHTDINWDSSTTKAWSCEACGWKTTNPEWIERFATPLA